MYDVYKKGVKMQIREYRLQERKKMTEAAELLGVSVHVYSSWEYGKRIPRADRMRKIYEWSDGQVRPEDFYLTDSDSEKEEKENG